MTKKEKEKFIKEHIIWKSIIPDNKGGQAVSMNPTYPQKLICEKLSFSVEVGHFRSSLKNRDYAIMLFELFMDLVLEPVKIQEPVKKSLTQLELDEFKKLIEENLTNGNEIKYTPGSEEDLINRGEIKGNSKDNRLNNLRIVCPNCNATLPTHCGKNINMKK